MLTLLKIKNIALIDELSIEFGDGLNLLTGETGSGKSIIVDSLGALTGERVSSELIKDGEATATIEGLFSVDRSGPLNSILEESGIEADGGDLIVRRELSTTGKNRVFVNGQLATQGFLKRIGTFLVDIYGQGEQTSLYNVDTHIWMLDEFAGVEAEKVRTAEAFDEWAKVRSELASVEKDSAEKLQLLDILGFQVSEIRSAGLKPNEDVELEEEKRRLNNVEKLTNLSDEAFSLLYDDPASTATTLEKARRKIVELADYETSFAEYEDGIASVRAVVEDLAFALRDFRSRLEFSPERLDEIEHRLAEILRLKRKYGGSVEAVLEHCRVSEERLKGIETAEFMAEELNKQLGSARRLYLEAADDLRKHRDSAGREFSKQVEQNLRSVALEKAKFEVRIEHSVEENAFSPNGSDKVEFFFSANPGESPKPLARVASGGEASRLMLILKTTINESHAQKTAVFDEVDIGIGGRVAEAVGRKLKDLSAAQQVLCVSHQPQIASLADRHFVVSKTVIGDRTEIGVRLLDPAEQIEEIARMLAGEQITDAARENARSMLAGTK